MSAATARVQTGTKPAPLPASSLLPARGGLLQRKCACGGAPGMDGQCEECRQEGAGLQRRPDSRDGPSLAPSIVHQALRSSGEPLDPAARALMEARFGHDFSEVRVHTDTAANRSADAMGARAYTSGAQIAFGTEQYRPGTQNGRALLAHELVHVLQQRSSSAPARQTITPYSHPAEVEARSLSEAVIKGGSASPLRPTVALNPQSVALQLDPQKIYCALHAAVCLGLSENPPAALLCWANFAQRCSGGMASGGQPSGDGALASEAPTSTPPEGEASGAGA